MTLTREMFVSDDAFEKAQTVLEDEKFQARHDMRLSCHAVILEVARGYGRSSALHYSLNQYDQGSTASAQATAAFESSTAILNYCHA